LLRWGDTRIQLPRSGFHRRWEMSSRMASGMEAVGMEAVGMDGLAFDGWKRVRGGDVVLACARLWRPPCTSAERTGRRVGFAAHGTIQNGQTGSGMATDGGRARDDTGIRSRADAGRVGESARGSVARRPHAAGQRESTGKNEEPCIQYRGWRASDHVYTKSVVSIHPRVARRSAAATIGRGSR
jgi:hypothetical protein